MYRAWSFKYHNRRLSTITLVPPVHCSEIYSLWSKFLKIVKIVQQEACFLDIARIDDAFKKTLQKMQERTRGGALLPGLNRPVYILWKWPEVNYKMIGQSLFNQHFLLKKNRGSISNILPTIKWKSGTVRQ